MVEGRCMRCKKQQEMTEVVLNKTSRGGNMLKGKCNVCGCGMAKIINSEDAKAYQ